MGKSDINQIRFFDKPIDMVELLGIQDDIIIDTDGNGIYGENISDFHPYDDETYWDLKAIPDVILKPFPAESPVTDIFISEYNQFKEICLFEINFNDIDDKSIYDTNGGGIKAILFGDFSVTKESKDVESSRDSHIKIPKIGKRNGAF